MGSTDESEVAIALTDAHPESSRDRALHRSARMGVRAPGFADDPARSGEKILEAIQMAWIDKCRARWA